MDIFEENLGIFSREKYMDIFEKIEGHIFGEIFKKGGIFLWVIFQGN